MREQQPRRLNQVNVATTLTHFRLLLKYLRVVQLLVTLVPPLGVCFSSSFMASSSSSSSSLEFIGSLHPLSLHYRHLPALFPVMSSYIIFFSSYLFLIKIRKYFLCFVHSPHFPVFPSFLSLLFQLFLTLPSYFSSVLHIVCNSKTHAL